MFNLKRHAQSNPQGGSETLLDGLQNVEDDLENEMSSPPMGQEGQPENPESLTNINNQFSPDQMHAAQMIASGMLAQKLLAEIAQSPNGEQIKNHLMTQSREWNNLQNQTQNPQRDDAIARDQRILGLSDQLMRATEFKDLENKIRSQISQLETMYDRTDSQRMQRRDINRQTIMSFNLKNHKTAQVSALQSNDDLNTFVQRFAGPLMSFQGDKGEGDAISENAKSEILRMVSAAGQEEVNSALEEVQSLPKEVGHSRAGEILKYVYDNWIAPGAANQQQELPAQNSQVPGMEPVMSENKAKGIIKHDLSQHVLNNKTMDKTAASHFGDPYFLYGPTEKRICPKLRGKGGGQPGSGDVVSEYICRNHCLDGIVIDDNKTICGEALWRSHVMDKFSREYVDAEGNITGGYIEKRFDVHHDVPEENKMRLKPGETRKPRPAASGNLESRMQDMRSKEGENRGYRPNTDKSKPFNWTKDVDQNNVEVSQTERDRRETASGHQTVQYTDKAKQENLKKSFNLKTHKVAQSLPLGMSPSTGVNSQPKPMTGPRGPVGPDNPKSDDLGLSPDMTGPEDYDDGLSSGSEMNPHPLVDEFISHITQHQDAHSMAQALNQMKAEGDQEGFKQHDWDDVINAVNDHIGELNGKEYIEVDPQTQQFVVKPIDDPSKPMLSQSPQTSPTTPAKPMLTKSPQISPTTPMAQTAGFNMSKTKEAAVENDSLKKVEVTNFPENTGCSTCKREKKSSGFNLSKQKEAKSPPGWGGTVEHMKERHSDEIDNPFALAWWMKNKGYKSHHPEKDKDFKKKSLAQVLPMSAPAAAAVEIKQPIQSPTPEMPVENTDPAQQQDSPLIMQQHPKNVAKPLLMQCCEHDEERIENLLDSLSDEELRIINSTNDPTIIIRIRDSVESDLNETAKSLCMDE